MTAALATVETDRIAKLVRLIFSTDKSGEALAAIAAVKRILASEKLDAHWLADRLYQSEEHQRHDDGDDRSLAWWCYHHRDRLSPRDRQFIEALTKWRSPLSPKQQKWLRDILAKLESEAA
jgi:hypothetical protein